MDRIPELGLKKFRLRLELEWDVEAPTSEDALDELAEQICNANENVENIFWGGIDIVEV